MSGIYTCRRWFIGLLTTIGGMYSFTGNCAAQITSDRTLPNNSRVRMQGNTNIIEGGTTAGNNLFHSFEQFSVDKGSTAYFNNAVGIQNIISRVTGKSVSNIDGLIRANGAANLFLINPNGIVFGLNATLDIGGSFLATTASSLKFTDGFEFATADKTTPLLTINVPIGLQFGGTAGSIVNQSQGINSGGDVGLRVQPGKTLALVGGEVKLNGGSIIAPNGRVEIGAIAGAGTIGLNFTNNNLSLSVPDSVPRADVSFTDAAIDVSDRGRGSVGITSRNLEILGGSSISAGIKPGLMAEVNPGDISLNATGVVKINYPSRVTNVVAQNAKGDAGDINIFAGDINIDNRAQGKTDSFIKAAVDTGPLGFGRAGNISMFATGSINLIGQFVDPADEVLATFSNIQGMFGGNLTLKANDIFLKTAYLNVARSNGGDISLIGNNSVSITDNSLLNAGATKGNSGNITIQSNGSVSIDRSLVGNNVGNDDLSLNAGEINISGRSVSITGGSLIQSSAEERGVKSGNIRINATDKVEISGYDPFHNPYNGDRTYAFVQTTLTTTSSFGSRGQAGDINITSPTLRVSDGANLVANSDNAFNGGNININAKVVELTSGGQLITSALNSGEAGNITLNVSDRLKIDGTNANFDNFRNQGFTVSNAGSASGIFASTLLSQGGNITIQGLKLLLLSHNAQISAQADTIGSGGNITINAPKGFIIAAKGQNSDITANAFSGNGGNVTITASGIFNMIPRSREDLRRLLETNDPAELNPVRLPTNDISAVSQANPSLNGTVIINTLYPDPSRELVELPGNLVDVSQQIDTSCHPGSKQQASSFVIKGRGGLPSNPKEILTPDAIEVDWVSLERSSNNRSYPSVTSKKTTTTAETIVEATGWVINNFGEVVLTANPSTITPHNSWQNPTTCGASKPSS